MGLFPDLRHHQGPRGDCLVFDRRHLGRLNFIEKFQCTYCEYGNGLMGFMAEILGTQARYNRFLDYGGADAYEAKLAAFRVALGKVK